MNNYKKFGIPDDFDKLLPELKDKTLRWETVCRSGTEINNNAKISYYASVAPYSYGNIVLSPGLGTNTDIDPLMGAVTFWALTHRYNIITIDTFLGQFLEKPSFEIAQKNTYNEFIASLESCVKFIEPYCINKPSLLIGHSAGATGITDALNNIVSKKRKINFQSVMLFAPWASKEWHDYFKEIVCRHNKPHNPYKFLPIINMFDIEKYGSARYTPILPDFLDDMEKSVFKPDLMNKWNTHITIVVGAKDRKVSEETLHKRYEELVKQSSDKNRFQFIVLPNAKHSFIQIHKDTQSVINLIKSQRIKQK